MTATRAVSELRSGSLSLARTPDAAKVLHLGRDRRAERLVVGNVGAADHQRLTRFDVDDLVAGDVDNLPGASPFHDVDGAVERLGAVHEVEQPGVVVVLVQRETCDAVDVVRAVNDMFDRSDWLPFSVEPHLTTAGVEVHEVVIEGPRRIKSRTVDRVRKHVLERVALGSGADRLRCRDSEREYDDGETDDRSLHDLSLPWGFGQPT